MKQTIEEAAEEYKKFPEQTQVEDEKEWARLDFIAGAKSDASREFHTQGMYSEEEVAKITIDFFIYWWNRKEGTNAYEGFADWFEEHKKKKNVP